MAGEVVGAVGVEVGDAILTVTTGGSAAVVSPATGALTEDAALPTVRVASTEGVGSATEVDSMVAAVEGSTVAAVFTVVAMASTVVAASMAAVVAGSTEVEVGTVVAVDTGNSELIRSSPTR